jgi:hypothetical protein
MKLFLIASTLAVLVAGSDTQCSGNKNKLRYKAKLEIKALCMNYTLRQVQGPVDTSLVAATWTDESTGKSYKNVFALANPCDFPDSIKQGDEFYFIIDTAKQQRCAVCMAYYPTPPKKLSIKVVPE